MATIKTRMSFSSVGDVTATNSVVSWFPRIRSEFRRAKGDLVRFFVSASTNSFNGIMALSASSCSARGLLNGARVSRRSFIVALRDGCAKFATGIRVAAVISKQQLAEWPILHGQFYMRLQPGGRANNLRHRWMPRSAVME